MCKDLKEDCELWFGGKFSVSITPAGVSGSTTSFTYHNYMMKAWIDGWFFCAYKN